MNRTFLHLCICTRTISVVRRNALFEPFLVNSFILNLYYWVKNYKIERTNCFCMSTQVSACHRVDVQKYGGRNGYYDNSVVCVECDVGDGSRRSVGPSTQKR